MEIQRYYSHIGKDHTIGMMPRSDGAWVSFTDHEQALAALEARNRDLEEQIHAYDLKLELSVPHMVGIRCTEFESRCEDLEARNKELESMLHSDHLAALAAQQEEVDRVKEENAKLQARLDAMSAPNRQTPTV